MVYGIKSEENSIYEAAKKKGIEFKKIDCKDLIIDLNASSEDYITQTISQEIKKLNKMVQMVF